ncbi:glucan 1,3-beta-glucosidase [Colletotrichum musicola]|uniref:Glucan 1,3-beta-glucosidase n=1 Tax=Colletotrichum musicola TaxID=2175873 RepID=A0A8H6J437_9PEZI|nr:glucan 1,3-beta-glucosidase [Colletotrichum musicola]
MIWDLGFTRQSIYVSSCWMAIDYTSVGSISNQRTCLITVLDSHFNGVPYPITIRNVGLRPDIVLDYLLVKNSASIVFVSGGETIFERFSGQTYFTSWAMGSRCSSKSGKFSFETGRLDPAPSKPEGLLDGLGKILATRTIANHWVFCSTHSCTIASSKVVTGCYKTGKVTTTGDHCPLVTLDSNEGQGTDGTQPVRSVGTVTQPPVVIIGEDFNVCSVPTAFPAGTGIDLNNPPFPDDTFELPSFLGPGGCSYAGIKEFSGSLRCLDFRDSVACFTNLYERPYYVLAVTIQIFFKASCLGSSRGAGCGYGTDENGRIEEFPAKATPSPCS